MGLTRDYSLNLEIKWNSIDGITNVPFSNISREITQRVAMDFRKLLRMCTSSKIHYDPCVKLRYCMRKITFVD